MKAFFSRGCGWWQGGWGGDGGVKASDSSRSVGWGGEGGGGESPGSAANGPSYGGEWTVGRGKLWRGSEPGVSSTTSSYTASSHCTLCACHQLSLRKAGRGAGTEERGERGCRASRALVSVGRCSSSCVSVRRRTHQPGTCCKEQRDSGLEQKRGA